MLPTLNQRNVIIWYHLNKADVETNLIYYFHPDLGTNLANASEQGGITNTEHWTSIYEKQERKKEQKKKREKNKNPQLKEAENKWKTENSDYSDTKSRSQI